jgi:hypothetical protein
LYEVVVVEEGAVVETADVVGTVNGVVGIVVESRIGFGSVEKSKKI